jgi:hypothetical protein
VHDDLLREPLGSEERMLVVESGAGNREQDQPTGARLLRRGDGREHGAVVRGEDLVIARLVHTAHQMHDRVDAREDLDQLVGLVHREDGDLRAEGSAASGRRTVARTSSRFTSARTIACPRTPDAPVTITVITADAIHARCLDDDRTMAPLSRDRARHGT